MKFKKRLLYTTIIFFTNIFSFAQTFQKTFGSGQGGVNNKWDYATSVSLTADGGYIVTGYTDGTSLGMDDIYLVRLNSSGDTLWTKVYGGTNKEYGRCVIQTADGGFAVCGETQSYGMFKNDVFLLKTDSSGTLLWAKTYGGNDEDYGYSLKQTADGGYIIAGKTKSFGNAAGYEDIYIIKTDASGTLQWTKTYGGTSDDAAFSVSLTTDGGYIVTGEEGSSEYGILLMKLNASGDTSWVKTIRGNYGGYGGYDVKQTADGGYVITGYATTPGFGSYDMFIVKTNTNGNVSWAKGFGSSSLDESRSVIQTADGGYLLAGYSYAGSQYSRMHVIKTNSSGVRVWDKAYNSNYGNEAYSAVQTADGGYAIAGYIYNNFANTLAGVYQGYDAFLVKTDANGNSSGCVTDSPGILDSTLSWTSYSPSLSKSSGATEKTVSMQQKFSKTNIDNAEIKINFSTTNVNCGTGCTGIAEAKTCDSAGFYCSGTAPYIYQWDNNASSQTNSTATGLCVGTYQITITDNNNCSGTATAGIYTQAIPVDICIVSVDSGSTKNVVVWQKPLTVGIDSFRIYRNIAGTYTHIGSTPYDSLSKFIDNTSGINPSITSYRYKITSVDTCGNESPFSAYHQTIHLTSNVGTSGEVNLVWSGYEGFGFTFYRILRYTPANGYFQKIDSVPSTNFTYTDWNPPAGTVYYLIEITPPSICVATKAAENHNSSRSNVSQKVNLPPVASFNGNPTTITQGNSVNFTDQSQNGVTTRTWYFSGGVPSTSTLASPVVTYNNTGCFDVKLVVSNGAGSDSVTQVCYITVNQGVAPSVDFNANTTNINVGSSINFTDISGNNPTSWLWKFQGGNPTTSTLKNPANINYNTIGCFDVTLIASNAFGTDSLTKTCYINVTAASGAPLANFTSTSTNIFVGDSIDFIDLSSNNPTSWQWIFTNGVPSTSTLKNPTGIKYNTPGCFEVTLIATNSSGSDNETKTCYINVGTNSINSEADNNFECHIFPNPSKGKITITFTNHTKQNKHIVITDLLGRIILEKNTSLFTVNFDLSNEFSGIYFLKYETNNQFIVKTIILEH